MKKRRIPFWTVAPCNGFLSLVVVAGFLAWVTEPAFSSDRENAAHQIVEFAELIGNLEGNAAICNIAQSQNALFYQEAFNNAGSIARARYKQLGIDENSVKTDKLKGYQQAKLAHQANAGTPDCRSFDEVFPFPLERPMARQAAEFIRRTPKNLSVSPDAGDRLPPDTPNEDFQVFPFAGFVGDLKGQAEICGAARSEYEDTVQTAEIVVKARYTQIGLGDKSADEDEERGYRLVLGEYAANRQRVNCAFFSRQVDNIEGWTARQGAEFIRKSMNYR